MHGLTSSAKLPKPDATAKFCYYRARYYDPNAGRFISEDPIRFDGGANFYSYVNNNSTDLVDPSGLLQVCCRPAHIGDKMFWLPKPKKPCHCFLKLSDGTTFGGYNKPPGILQKKPNDPDDKNPKDTPSCTPVPGPECKVRQSFNNYPRFQPYGFGGTSNTVAADVLADAGISFTFPSCAWGAGGFSAGPPTPVIPYLPF